MASADYVEVEKDGVFYGLYTDYLTAEVISNPNGYTGDIVIAETVVYNDVNYNVTTISNGSFLNGNLSSITIPKTIKTISGYAFRDSQGFNECKGPAVIKISNLSAWCSIDLDQHSIGYGYQLFLNGVEINDLVVPNDVSVINEYAFYGCKSIKTVTIPGNVSSIGRAAFMWCDNLTSVNMEDGVKTIGREAFRSCGALSSVTFPPNLVSIEKDAFNGCSSLASAAIPEGVTKINASTFKGCSSLKSLSIPNSVTDIESGAFYDCSSLASVTIPNSVTYIGPNTFQGCSNLETIELSNDLTRITDYMFYDCGKLNSIVIPEGVTSIENGSFQNCANLPSINIPKTVTSIASAAFSGCSSLTSIELPAGLGSIGESVFSGCTALTTVTILDGLTTIAHGSFSGCSSLTTITIPASVTGIRDYAFEGCENLSSVNISDLVSWCKIDFSSWNSNPLNYAHHLFLNGEEIKDVVLSDNLTSIARWAFSGCSSISSVAIPNSITSIGAYAFNDCNNMTLVTIPNSIGGLPDGTFSGCSSLTSIDLPNSIKSLGEDVFRQSGLTSVIIPNGVTKIGPGAFSECKNLSDVTIPETITSIGNYAFWYCKNLTKIISQITAPQTVTIYGDALLDVNKDAIILVPCGTKGLYESTNVLKDFKICEADYCAPEDAIIFEDEEVEKACLDPDKWNLDTNHDGYLTKDEAAAVTSLNIKNYAYLFKSFDEFQYFTGLTLIPDYTFRDCEKLTSIIIPNSITYIGIEAFRGCTGLTSITVPKSVTTMDNRVFLYCTGLTSVTFEGSVIGDDPFGTSSAIIDYSKLTSVTIGENVKTIGESAFHGLKGVTSITIPDGVTTIGAWAFCKCTGLNSLTIGKNVNTMGKGAFSSCSNLRSIVSYILEPFEIEMYTFDSSHGAELKVPTGTKEKYLALDYWKDFKNIVEMDDLVVEQGYAVFNSETGTLTFKYGEKPAGDNVYDTDNTDYTWESQAWDCSQIKKVVFDPSFAAARPKSTTHWFYKSESLTEIVGIEYLNTSEVTTMRGMFSGCGNLTNLDVHKFVTDNVTNMAWMFENCSSLKSLDVSKFNTSNVTDLGAMFDNCPSLTNLDVSHFDTGNAKSLNSMFRGCSGLTSLDVSNFNTGNATDVCGMFENCSSLKSLDVSKFNTSNVIDLGAMFANCPSLTSLDVRHFDTSNAKSLNSMFRDCSGLTLIDLSSFDTSNAINMGAMFKNCNSLTTIHVGEKWNTTNVEDSDEMFAGCEKLVGGKGTAYDADHVDATYARIDGGVDNPGYYTGTVSESITISKALQVTYMSDKNLDFTGYPDLKAYVATGYDKSSGTIWLTRVKYVPANTGILLMGEAGDYEIPVKKGESTSYYMNLFKGTIEGTTIQTTDGDNTNYYLSKGDAGVGFYKVQGSVELKPNRAYLSVPTEIPVVGATGSTETIKVSAARQVPYYNSQSLDFSSLDAQGVKAYTATGYDYSSGTIWLTRVKQVPAKTGILIMAPEGEYPVPTASISSVYANMFRGTLEGTTIQTHEEIDGKDYINYYLSSGESGVGFYRVTKEEGVKIGANRCYLPILNKDAAAGTRSANSDLNQIAFEEADEVIGIQLLRGIGDDEDGTTNLTPALSKGEGEWYTLQGQRVAKPGKGLYIRNGKVVVIK